MSWPVSVTPEASQTLRGDQIKKQFLQGRGYNLESSQTSFQYQGSEALKWPGTSGARVQGEQPRGEGQRRVREADTEEELHQDNWKQEKDPEPRRG
jgi:hypothetical protein